MAGRVADGLFIQPRRPAQAEARMNEMVRDTDRITTARSGIPGRTSGLQAASAVRAASRHSARTIAAALPGVEPSNCGA